MNCRSPGGRYGEWRGEGERSSRSRRPRTKEGDERSSHEAQSCQVQPVSKIGGILMGRERRKREVVGGEKKWCGLKWRPQATRRKVTTAPSQKPLKAHARSEGDGGDSGKNPSWGWIYELCAGEKKRVGEREGKRKRGKVADEGDKIGDATGGGRGNRLKYTGKHICMGNHFNYEEP